ncbi:hypothetical protein FACS189413_13750 [Bacteroidia bacterium]|nr:hypothetical protein FACS189413_13750 [Bacteroidia bacterium]
MNLFETETPNLTLDQLTEDIAIGSFESEDEELNDFLQNDAKNYLTSLLAVTYLIRTYCKRDVHQQTTTIRLPVYYCRCIQKRVAFLREK